MELERCCVTRTAVKLEYYDVLIEFDKSSVVNAIIRISTVLNEYIAKQKKIVTHLYFVGSAETVLHAC